MTHDIDNDDPDAFDGLLQNSNEFEPVDDSNFEGLTTEGAASVAFAPSYIQLRRRLDKALKEAKKVQKDLADIENSKSTICSLQAASVIACVVINERFPIDDPDDELYRKALDGVKSGRLLRKYLSEALAEIESLIDILQKGKSSLHVLDQFDRPTLLAWSNLRAPALARAINAHAYIIFQAAIVR